MAATASLVRSVPAPLPSRISRRRKAVTQPDAIFLRNVHRELSVPRLAVADAEARATKARKPVGTTLVCNKTRANDLHQEADKFYEKGDYESALVLYNRAARMWPRNAEHAAAARRVEAAINSVVNPPRRVARWLRKSGDSKQISMLLSQDVTAHKPREIIDHSDDPIGEVSRILKSFDAQKDAWRLTNLNQPSQIARLKLKQRQLYRLVASTCAELENAYDASDFASMHKLGDELVNLASLTEEPDVNRIDVYEYLATKQIHLNRHDKAIEMASKMFFVARTNGDTLLLVRALRTIGNVHLRFKHLDALVRVWIRLANVLKMEPIAQAWLHHEIGRCHLELGNYEEALERAKRCIEQSNNAKSAKWLIRGYLLSGQSLLKIGRFGESVAALKIAAQCIEEGEEDHSILSYIQDLMEQVTYLLRQMNCERDRKIKLRQSESLANSISKTNIDQPDVDAETKLIQESIDEKSVQMEREHENDSLLLLMKIRSLGHDRFYQASTKSLSMNQFSESFGKYIAHHNDQELNDEEILQDDELEPLPPSDESDVEKINDGDTVIIEKGCTKLSYS